MSGMTETSENPLLSALMLNNRTSILLKISFHCNKAAFVWEVAVALCIRNVPSIIGISENSLVASK